MERMNLVTRSLAVIASATGMSLLENKVQGQVNPLFPSNGLAAYYTLDEPSGTIIHDALSNINGTYNGSGLGTTGVINNAINFDTSHMINFGNNFNYSTGSAFSIAGWLKMNTTEGQWILGKANYTPGVNVFEYRLGVGEFGNNELEWSVDVLSAEAKEVIVPNIIPQKWYFFVGTYNNGELGLYLDGTSRGTSRLFTSGGASSANFDIGGVDNLQGLQAFNGTIDEVGIWNRVLTNQEVESLYNQGQGLPYYVPAPSGVGLGALAIAALTQRKRRKEA